MAMSPRQRAAMMGLRGPATLENEGSDTPWSAILGTLGTIGGGIAAPFTGGASLAAGPALAGVGAGIEAAQDGDELEALAGTGQAAQAIGGAYAKHQEAAKRKDVDRRMRERLAALGISR